MEGIVKIILICVIQRGGIYGTVGKTGGVEVGILQLIEYLDGGILLSNLFIGGVLEFLVCCVKSRICNPVEQLERNFSRGGLLLNLCYL